MLSAGVSLERALGAFTKMYRKEPGLPLRALGFFKDGDLLAETHRHILRLARDRVAEIQMYRFTTDRSRAATENKAGTFHSAGCLGFGLMKVLFRICES